MRRIQNFWIRPEPDPPIFMDPVPEPEPDPARGKFQNFWIRPEPDPGTSLN